MRFNILITALSIVTLTTVASAAEEEIYVDRDACPGEHCTYCEIHVAVSEFLVYKSPSKQSTPLTKIPLGDAFISKSGEVHTMPKRVTVVKEIGDLKPGDELFILTYSSEGYYRARHNGKMTHVGLDFHPWSGRNRGVHCQKNDDYCWGEIDGPIESTWWMYVVSENGAQGWIIFEDSFVGNSD